MRIWKLYEVCWDNNKKRKKSRRWRRRGGREKTGHPSNKFLISKTDDVKLQ